MNTIIEGLVKAVEKKKKLQVEEKEKLELKRKRFDEALLIVKEEMKATFRTLPDISFELPLMEDQYEAWILVFKKCEGHGFIAVEHRIVGERSTLYGIVNEMNTRQQSHFDLRPLIARSDYMIVSHYQVFVSSFESSLAAALRKNLYDLSEEIHQVGLELESYEIILSGRK